MYRKNVCAVIINNDQTQVLMFKRIGAEDWCWQFPQGGVDGDESENHAIYRELKEEIGTNEVVILKKSKQRVRYKFPKWVLKKFAESGKKRKKYKGQKQRWYLVQLVQGEESIHFKHQPAEFEDKKWVTPIEALELIVPFKQKATFEGFRQLGLM